MLRTLIIERDGRRVEIFIGDDITARGDFGDIRLAHIPPDAYGAEAPYRVDEKHGQPLLGTGPVSRHEVEDLIAEAYRSRGYEVRLGTLATAAD